jgi:hypothetical protein
MTASSKSQSPNAVRSISSMAMDETKNDAKETNASARGVFGTADETIDKTELLSVHETRSLILRLSVLVGNLCSLFLQSIPLDGASVSTGAQTLQSTPGIQMCMAELLSGLMSTAASVSINLETAILKKMELNGKKYPVHLCKVRRRNNIVCPCVGCRLLRWRSDKIRIPLSPTMFLVLFSKGKGRKIYQLFRRNWNHQR